MPQRVGTCDSQSKLGRLIYRVQSIVFVASIRKSFSNEIYRTDKRFFYLMKANGNSEVDEADNHRSLNRVDSFGE